MRIALLCVVFAACREAGTIEIGPSDALASCPIPATHVRVYLVPDGDCGRCTCTDNVTCPNSCTKANCFDTCDGDGPCRRPLDALPENGIVFDPPPGEYAAVFVYSNGDGASVSARACQQFKVESDGTQSSTRTATTSCCGI